MVSDDFTIYLRDRLREGLNARLWSENRKDILSTAAEYLAERIHEAHERLAPKHGYDTTIESRQAWSDVPENRKRLMIAVCQELLDNKVISVL